LQRPLLLRALLLRPLLLREDCGRYWREWRHADEHDENREGE
jgi:hypothetical protein